MNISKIWPITKTDLENWLEGDKTYNFFYITT